MENSKCQITASELKALFETGLPEDSAKALEQLVDVLTSHDRDDRTRGYEMFETSVNDALFCSCLNYGSLVGGFTHPLREVMAKAIEFWAEARANAN